MTRRENTPPAALEYAAAPTHPGRFRVHALPDGGVEVELVPRSAAGKVPWVVLCWLLAAAAVGWLVYMRRGGAPLAPSLAVLAFLAPLGAAGFTAMLVLPDRQRLSIRVDRGGLTLLQFPFGMPDRHHFPLDTLLLIDRAAGQSRGDLSRQAILLVTQKGVTGVQVMREPEHVQEMCAVLRGAVEALRSDAPEAPRAAGP